MKTTIIFFICSEGSMLLLYEKDCSLWPFRPPALPRADSKGHTEKAIQGWADSFQ